MLYVQCQHSIHRAVSHLQKVRARVKRTELVKSGAYPDEEVERIVGEYVAYFLVQVCVSLSLYTPPRLSVSVRKALQPTLVL